MLVTPGRRAVRGAAGCALPVLCKMATRVAAPFLALPLRVPALLLPLLLLRVEVSLAACSNASVFSEQLDTLLAEYDRGAPPAARLSLELTLDVRHATVDERSSSVRMLADLQMRWEDARLTWNSSAWGCSSAPVPAERLWLPDVTLVSAATRGAEPEGLRARVFSDGRISWTSRLDLSAPLALRLEDWPRDLHTAVFKFASRDRDSDELNLTIGRTERMALFESGGWELASLSHSEETWKRGGGGGERRVASWALGLRRRAPAHSLATTAVLAAATLLLMASMLLPPADRPPLCACASFTAALWLISALVRLPGSATTPLSVTLLGAVCSCGGLAALCAALVRRLAAVNAPPPHCLRPTLAAASAICSLTPECGGESGTWAAAAQLLDYLLQAALALSLLVIVCFYL